MHVDVEELGRCILNAPLTQNGWTVALRRLAELTHSRHGQLIAIGADYHASLNIANDIEPSVLDEFERAESAYSTSNWRVSASQGPGRIVHEAHYAQVRNTLDTRVYEDLARTFDIPNGCQTTLSEDKRGLLGMAVLRGEAQGETSEEDRAIFAAAAPFVQAAVNMQNALRDEGAKLLTGTLDAMHACAFLLDGSGAILGKTQRARAATEHGTLVHQVRNTLCARQPDENARLQSAVRCAADSRQAFTQISIGLGSRLPVQEQRVCDVFRLDAQQWADAFGPRVLVTLRMHDGLDGRNKQLLQDLIGLTPAEAAIALELADGTPRDVIAEHRGGSTETVTTQIKRIFRKADVTREAELVALLNRMLR